MIYTTTLVAKTERVDENERPPNHIFPTYGNERLFKTLHSTYGLDRTLVRGYRNTARSSRLTRVMKFFRRRIQLIRNR